MSVVVKFTKKKLPKEVVAHWPEVFNDLRIDSIPVQYLLALKVQFKDGKQWEIKVKPNRQKNPRELRQSQNYPCLLENPELSCSLHLFSLNLTLPEQ